MAFFGAINQDKHFQNPDKPKKTFNSVGMLNGKMRNGYKEANMGNQI